MYDYAHGQSDSLERVTHSMCTLEFTDHQPLYRWFIEQLGIFPTQQFEFDRLNLTYTLLSKRKLLQLVQEKRVNGWNDPRMPTLSGIRRRGFTPEALRAFVAASGVSRTNGSTDIEMLEHYQRDDLNRRARRAMAVLRPLKLVIDNYPEGPNQDQVEFFEVANNPEDASAGTRQVPFSRELFIEQDDFRETPPPKYHRLSPGKEVRLRNAYFVTAQRVAKDAAGNIVEVHCTYDPATRGGDAPDGRKVKSTIHWVSAAHAIGAEIRLYDRLFTKADPYDLEEGQDVLDNLNPNSIEIVTGAKLEPSLASAKLGEHLQFERVGYFCLDTDSTPAHLAFNRTLPLKDSWAKIEKTTCGGAAAR
jgi:glutaminyl-tRNA synthetase